MQVMAINLPNPTHDIAIWDVRDTEPFKPEIVHALDQIQHRCHSIYSSDQVYGRLRHRAAHESDSFAMRAFFDKSQPHREALPGAFVGLMTLDLCHDEMNIDCCMISRAWCVAGIGKTLWQPARPMVLDWANQRNCQRILLQTTRDSGWFRWARAEGWTMRETTLEINLGGQ